MELYGSPTTKELKKKHSSRLVGWSGTGSGAEKTQGKEARKQSVSTYASILAGSQQSIFIKLLNINPANNIMYLQYSERHSLIIST